VPDTLLVFFRICVLALLYLFFFRVLRAVWTEISVSPTAATATRRRERRPRDRRPKSEAHLKVVEPQEMAGATFSLADELTIGRAVGCQITLDDTYVSQLHARVFRRDGQLYVEDLGSTNGTYLNRGKVQGPMIIKRGDRLQVGQVVMELR
jgi:hypothetical protein